MAATQTVPAPLVLPIGHYGGAFPADDDSDTLHEIRRGGELIQVPDDVFRVWALSHRSADWPPNQRWTRQAMLDRARLLDMDNAEDALNDLIGDRLVVEVRLGVTSAREVARGLHMHPTMLGLGNSAENPTAYALGFVGSPLVQVSRTIFELWRWAPVERNLWDLCRFFAETEREHHGTIDPERTDPDVVLTELLEALPTLLSSGAVYLDLAE